MEKAMAKVLLKSFEKLVEIICSKESSNSEIIQAINCLIDMNSKIEFIIGEENAK